MVVYCHSKTSVMAQFLFRAQDNDMTNGDYAFFTFFPARTSRTDRPWLMYADDADELRRRRQAFYAVKQVSMTLFVGCGKSKFRVRSYRMRCVAVQCRAAARRRALSCVVYMYVNVCSMLRLK